MCFFSLILGPCVTNNVTIFGKIDNFLNFYFCLLQGQAGRPAAPLGEHEKKNPTLFPESGAPNFIELTF